MKAAFRDAALSGDARTIAAMLGDGAEVDALDRYGQTALMIAAHHGRLDAVVALVEAGADLDVTAKFGLSALMLAVVSGHPHVVEALVTAGADRTLTGSGTPGFHRKTALDLAEQLGRTDITDLLRSADG